MGDVGSSGLGCEANRSQCTPPLTQGASPPRHAAVPSVSWHVVLASAAAVALDNVHAKDPLPQVLLYGPAPNPAADWLDFDGPDGPYELVGWAYLTPYQPGSRPPIRPCVVVESDWWVHEAGWHLRDGGMLLTPERRSSRSPIPTGPARVSSCLRARSFSWWAARSSRHRPARNGSA